MPAINNLNLSFAALSKKALIERQQIHSHITHRGFAFPAETIFKNKLINMYVKCCSLLDARQVFDQMTERDIFSWNIIIGAYRRHGYPHEALTLFHRMQQAGIQPDDFTISSILPACAKIRALKQGMGIHQSIMERGISSDVVENALVDMYAKCGNIYAARKLFDKMPQKNVISWTAMVVAYTQNGYSLSGFVGKALETFKQMQFAGVKPVSATFASILPGCAKMGALEQGIYIHQSIIESGFSSDVVAISALVDMYAKCGTIHKARELFDKMPQRDVVSWNAMIAGYAKNGDLDEALKLFKEMPQRDVASWNAMIAGYAQNGFLQKALTTLKQMQLTDVKPDSSTFISILPACAKMGALKEGMEIHQSIIENGFLSDVLVASALIDMYAKCGNVHTARDLFDMMPQRNVVSWNSMIGGYAQNGFFEKALEAFKQMQLAGKKPDYITFASILPACAEIGVLEHGMDIHQNIIESKLLSDVVVASALVDMYAKCGSIHMAREVFDQMSQKNVISWNAMIVGYAQNGFCKDALQLFELMKHSGTHPDDVSFACVLLACSHAGLVDEGCKIFNGMSDTYYIMPTINHYVSMVDLLGRAGYLEETLNFIFKMPIKPVVVVWTCLLGACREHKNIGLGVFVATFLFELDPKNSATYVLLSNIYAEGGRWVEVQMVRGLMKDRVIKKIPGCSWIEGQNLVHAFWVGDTTHPQI
ncbi:pentatricopeptide repeat-containing protein At2g13600 [Cryptomeria japonica]|uniref:pentatricopeptide repeat-containing protein At2g13600 n=1 Tax=Cryptomeria japonica TaxID=3369 RepID=UPI0027DA1C89|nr:pentatricopeptide repeat-containing protein At2g13600 [Cryptomeria japonica]